MFAILVTFRVAQNDVSGFLEAVCANAAASLAAEPGCRRFDVLTDPQINDAVVLYEIYDDEAAFDHHRQTEHYKAFDQQTTPMVREKTVRALDLVNGR